MDNNIDEIIDRKWEIEEILFFEDNSDFIKLLKEAEALYEFGFYTSCIALIGISAEDYTKYLANKIGKREWESKTQQDRLKLMHESKLISTESYALMNDIRNIRNDCLHYSQNFKKKDNRILKKEALSVMNNFKDMLKISLGFKESMTVDKFNDIVKAAINELSISENKYIKNFDDLIFKERNALSQLFNLDITIKPGTELISRESIYIVAEVDFNFKEVMLIDTANGYPVVIDLSETNITQIQGMNLIENDIVYGAITSTVDAFGQTAAWTLTRIKKNSLNLISNQYYFD
ncbi:hypothetical protein [Paenibacillus hamazuiensis]|uniref:hypothetical protein n=1 Tax=Paenibacillus hamazuiensis TaxID=2936508 RepID=UPI00200E4AB1|nr:hypothetical protein [Paenibacillus hamazuiensis]